MVTLNGWDLATSVRLEYLNKYLTQQVAGQTFSATEDSVSVTGKFVSWELKPNTDGGKPDLIVTASGNLSGGDESDSGFDHLCIRFQVDIAHLPKSASNPDDFVHLKFDAIGIGKGDVSTFTVSDNAGHNNKLSETDRELVATLVINAICANKTMAAMPIAVLMSKTSINASWYRPTHVEYTITTLESGETYISILVCVDDHTPPAGKPQAPAGMHQGYVNMVLSRNIFRDNVLISTLDKRLPSKVDISKLPDSIKILPDPYKKMYKKMIDTVISKKHLFWLASGDPLSSFNWPSVLINEMGKNYKIPAKYNISMNVDLKSASAGWSKNTLQLYISGELYLAPGGVLTSIASNTQWYTFNGSCKYTIGFNAGRQVLTLAHQSCTDGTTKAKGVIGVLGSIFVKPPKVPLNPLVHYFCGLESFPSPDKYSFLWEGMSTIKYQAADFNGDILFSSAKDSY